jgi:hypothetical protein
VSNTELIEELTDICIRQAEIIQDRAYVLEQFGAATMEEESLRSRFRTVVREWNDE